MKNNISPAVAVAVIAVVVVILGGVFALFWKQPAPPNPHAVVQSQKGSIPMQQVIPKAESNDPK